MKKFIAIALLLALCLGLVACGTPAEKEPAKSGLEDAVAYLKGMYKSAKEPTPADFERIGTILLGDTKYTVTWTAKVTKGTGEVKIAAGANGMVTIDVDDKNPEEVTYELTGTVADAEGKTQSVTFIHRVPAAIILDEGMSYEEIVKAAYKLEDGLAMEGTFRLFGTITKIDTPYSDQYKNVTVTIQIGDLADMPIMCYRLKGDGAENLKVGDKITVEGVLKNYKGTIEFDAGCVLLAVGYDKKDQTAILDAAYKLEDGLAMKEPVTLAGVITKIDTPYSPDYKNITVTIVCDGIEDKPMMCYRLKGEGADGLAIGDTIVVTGIIKNYKGTIEFDAGCTLDLVIKSNEPAPVAPTDPAEIMAAAAALAEGGALPYEAKLTGVITSVDTPYSPDYKNVTVTISVNGTESSIQCYRLKGEGADTLAVGDTITVTGFIVNYGGAVQFNAGCQVSDIVKG